LEIHKNGKLKHPYFAQAILKYGWDRKNYDYSWNEEYKNRIGVLASIIVISNNSKGSISYPFVF
jgi:hypothetical protein